MEHEQSHYDDSAFDDVAAGPETDTDSTRETQGRSDYRDETYNEDSGHLSRSDEEEFEKFFGGRGNSEARDKVGESSYGSISDADNKSEGSDSDEWAAEGLGSGEPDFDMGDDLDFDGTPDEDEDEDSADGSESNGGEGFLSVVRSRAAELVDDDGDDQDTFRSRLADLIEPDEEGGEEYSPSDFDHDYEPAEDGGAEDSPEEGRSGSADDADGSSGAEYSGKDEEQPVDSGDRISATRGETVSYTIFRGGDGSEDKSQGDDESGAESRFSEPWTGDYGDRPYAPARGADSEGDFGSEGGDRDSSAGVVSGGDQDEKTENETASGGAGDTDFEALWGGSSDSDDDSGRSPMHEELMREFEQQRAENEHKIAGRTLYFDDDIDADEEDW